MNGDIPENKTMRVRINVGAPVMQDHGFGRWPANASGKEVDPHMIFDAEWNGKHWDCRADGFGRRTWAGEKGGYGNGSIFVTGEDGVTIVKPCPTCGCVPEYREGQTNGQA